MLLRLQRLNLDLKFQSSELDPQLSKLMENLIPKPESKASYSKSTTPMSTATFLSKLTTPNRVRVSPKLEPIFT